MRDDPILPQFLNKRLQKHKLLDRSSASILRIKCHNPKINSKNDSEIILKTITIRRFSRNKHIKI